MSISHPANLLRPSRPRAGFIAARVGVIAGITALCTLGAVFGARGTPTKTFALPASEAAIAQAPIESPQSSALPSSPSTPATQVTPVSHQESQPPTEVAAPITLASSLPAESLSVTIIATPARGLGPPVPPIPPVEASSALPASQPNKTPADQSPSDQPTTNPTAKPTDKLKDKPAKSPASPPPAQPQIADPVSEPSTEQRADPTAKPATKPAANPASTPAPKAAASSAAIIDLNTATKAQLELLPGVGPALAQRVLDHRAKVGSFTKVEDLDAVRGFGPKLLAKVKPFVKVETAQTQPPTPAQPK